ncbi:MAG: LuxR C-terminal-related transcriptional regulator [Actinomycetota bacterium]
MATFSKELEAGRAAFASGAWTNAYERLTAADRDSPLEPEDLVRMAMAAYLIGRDTDSIDILTRAHNESVNRGGIAHAARCAFWLGFQLINKGDVAQAGGWFARGGRILGESGLDCAEQGYMLVPVALQHLFGHDFETALSVFTQANDIAERFGDADLRTLTRLGCGQAMVGSGHTHEGLTLLDEVMVAVTAGETSAIVAGLVYCAVIAACQLSFDLRRAQEWTEALTRWCAAQPDLVPYRGQCLIHRTELMVLRGAWPDAITEADRACETLSHAPDQGAVGMAFYELGEVHRLRGDFAEAEEAYRQANQWGHPPQPGLAKLRLAQGEVGAAAAATRRVLEEATDFASRCKVLPAHVEIMLAADDVPAARGAADELSTIADDVGTPLVHALAAYAQGAVLLAEGDVRAALVSLRRAWTTWQELQAPYEAARARVLMGIACRALGDEDTGAMELEAALWIFEQLGAAPDATRVGALIGTPPSKTDGLTGREVQVLALVATGKTNREIAADLVISEKTVARHLSNIFTKLGVTSRAAATAYAFQHDLV